MGNTATSVADYIEGQQADWRPALKQLRAACRRELKGYTEALRYGMPAHVRDGRVEVGFGKQSQYLSLYILKQPVMDAHRAELAGLSLGKGCIRYRRPDQIDWKVVAGLLHDTRNRADDIC
jgi:uncharacterized protein YdhG (YjbR/CyaY superfamily)